MIIGYLDPWGKVLTNTLVWVGIPHKSLLLKTRLNNTVQPRLPNQSPSHSNHHFHGRTSASRNATELLRGRLKHTDSGC